jgi:hypothetical protein
MSKIPKNVKDALKEELSSAKTPGKRYEAKATAKRRMIIKFGMPWWNEHRVEIEKEIDEIEAKNE